jgi:hypothetical protein
MDGNYVNLTSDTWTSTASADGNFVVAYFLSPEEAEIAELQEMWDAHADYVRQLGNATRPIFGLLA